MKSTIPMRFWVEAGFASLCAVLSVLTLLWREWIEVLTGFDPDHHNGSFEVTIVAASLLLVGVVTSLIARAEWRRPRAAVAAGT